MANITEEFLGSAGLLQIQNGVALDSTLRVVTDQSNIASTLYLSTNQVRIGTTANDTPLALFGNKNISAIFNVFQLSSENKTFTLPDVNMTFAGINIIQTFTAAQTFDSPSEAGLYGSPIRILTNPWTSGNANQNHPLLLFGPHGGSIWAASPNGGTYIGINAVASFPGNFLDFHVNGGTSVFKVAASGAVTSSSSMTLGSSSLSAIRLYVKSDGTNNVFRVDNSSTQRLFEVDNNNRLILGNSGLLLAYGNSNFALTSQLATGYSYIFGNAQTKASASSVTGTLQLNESISNPSGATSSYRGVELNYSINNSAGTVSGTATGIFVNGTETGSGLNGMTHNLMDLQTTISGTTTSKFKVDRTGAVTLGSLFVGGSGYFAQGTANTTGTIYGIQSNLNIVPPAGSALFKPYEILYTINASGAQTGTTTGIFLNATETALNGMTHNLMDLQRGGVSQFRVDRVGAFSCGNTVAAAIGIASTHKVTVVIGGVTYYLLASNV